MKTKRKSAFKTILGFEYISVIKNKAFIISTILVVATLILTSFLPALIIGLTSSDSSDEETEKPKIAVVNKAYEKDDVIVKAITDNFNDYDVEIIKSESDAQTGVKDGLYSFSIILNKPLEYNYITLTQSIYDTTTDMVDTAITSAYRTTELEKKGISAQESEKILSASAKRNIVTLGTDQTTAYISTYILVMALYMAILAYGQLVANSVVTEKSSRAMEMLITCASPSDLMFGKVIGAGLAGFTQIAVIFGVGAISLPVMLNSIISFPIESALFAILFFVLAFFIYAFVFAAIASLVSRIEDLSSIMSPVMFIIIFVFMAVVFGMNSGELNSPLMITISYIPFTAPIAMFARIAMSDVAAWEIIISVAIQVASVFILGKLAAAIYRVGVLLYGKPPKLGQALKMVFSKKARS